MTSPSDILGNMAAVADEQTANLESSIGQVEEQVDQYTEEIDGVENGLCGAAETDMTMYLDGDKLTELQALWPEVPATLGPVYIVYGATYGTIAYGTGNVTDWEFRQDNLVPGPPVPPDPLPGPPDPAYYVRYVYTPGDDTTIDGLVSDFAFGNDYLTRPLTSGATYGLYDNLSSMNDAKNILESNKDKIVDSKAIFDRYS